MVPYRWEYCFCLNNERITSCLNLVVNVYGMTVYCWIKSFDRCEAQGLVIFHGSLFSYFGNNFILRVLLSPSHSWMSNIPVCHFGNSTADILAFWYKHVISIVYSIKWLQFYLGASIFPLYPLLIFSTTCQLYTQHVVVEIYIEKAIRTTILVDGQMCVRISVDLALGLLEFTFPSYLSTSNLPLKLREALYTCFVLIANHQPWINLFPHGARTWDERFQIDRHSY